MRKVGLLGAGAIGSSVIDGFTRRELVTHRLDAILVRARQADQVRARVSNETLVTIYPEEFLSRGCDLVVEAATHEAVVACGPPILDAGIDLYLMSVGVLADENVEASLRDAASRGGGRIVIPSGALGAFDGLRAMARMVLDEVVYTSIKQPVAWTGTPGETLIEAAGRDETLTLFQGSAREAAKLFPQNANLAAAVAIAGLGFERTKVRLISDPNVTGNTGIVSARSPNGTMTLTMNGAAFAENPKSSELTSASIFAALTGDVGDLVFR